MNDETATNPERVAPAGAPIRVADWLVPPVVLVGLAVIEVFAAVSALPRAVSYYRLIAVIVLLVAAVALWVFGYRAYRDLSPQAVQRYLVTGVVSLLLTGILLSGGVSVIGALPLVFAGRLSATLRFRPLRLMRSALPARLWLRSAVIAAIVGVLCYLISPLAQGLGFAPLIVIVVLGRIVSPIAFGYAFRLRPGASGIF